jgi:hypothetical protein
MRFNSPPHAWLEHGAASREQIADRKISRQDAKGAKKNILFLSDLAYFASLRDEGI